GRGAGGAGAGPGSASAAGSGDPEGQHRVRHGLRSDRRPAGYHAGRGEGPQVPGAEADPRHPASAARPEVKMSRQTRPSKVTLDRERGLHLYAAALERADLETMERIHREAEGDPVLARQIQELEEHDATFYAELALEDDAELVRGLLLRHLQSAQAEE